MHDISLFNLNVITIHPIHELFSWIQVFEHRVLLSSVMSLDFILWNPLFLEELGLIGKAGQDYLVST